MLFEQGVFLGKLSLGFDKKVPAYRVAELKSEEKDMLARHSGDLKDVASGRGGRVWEGIQRRELTSVLYKEWKNTYEKLVEQSGEWKDYSKRVRGEMLNQRAETERVVYERRDGNRSGGPVDVFPQPLPNVPGVSSSGGGFGILDLITS